MTPTKPRNHDITIDHRTGNAGSLQSGIRPCPSPQTHQHHAHPEGAHQDQGFADQLLRFLHQHAYEGSAGGRRKPAADLPHQRLARNRPLQRGRTGHPATDGRSHAYSSRGPDRRDLCPGGAILRQANDFSDHHEHCAHQCLEPHCREQQDGAGEIELIGQFVTTRRESP